MMVALCLACAGVAADEQGDGDGERLDFGAGVEVTTDRLSNFSLGTEARDDLVVNEAEVVTEIGYRPRTNWLAFGEIALIAEREHYADDTRDESVDALERGEMWLRFRDVFGRDSSMTLGRQAFEDPRRWWWDDDLDAVRAAYRTPALSAWLAVAEQVARTDTSEDFIDPEAEDVRRVLAHAGWRASGALRLDLFGLVQRDRSGQPRVGGIVAPGRADETDLDAGWLGLRASGVLGSGGGGHLRYWGDIGGVSGDITATEFDERADGSSRATGTTRRELRGWAADLGLEWTFAVTGEPWVRINYARGSGDPDSGDGIDEAYRETGLRDPDEEFRAYGELFRPGLSNIQVGTLALGVTAWVDTRVAVGYHRFRQVYVAQELGDARIEAEPTGDSRALGSELSLVLEVGRFENAELELAAAAFRAGDAFGEAAGRHAHSLFAKLAWEF